LHQAAAPPARQLFQIFHANDKNLCPAMVRRNRRSKQATFCHGCGRQIKRRSNKEQEKTAPGILTLALPHCDPAGRRANLAFVKRGSAMIDTPTIAILLEQWIEAFNSRDLDRHMQLYADDATLFGSTDQLKIGRDAIRQYFAARGPGVRVKSYPMPRIAELGSDVAATAGFVDFADGDTPSPYRMTWVLVRRAGNWRIAQHHGSPRRQ
jgi:uncharacterized protein (TIGR02246 family)